MHVRRMRRKKPPASKKQKALRIVLLGVVMLAAGMILLDLELRPTIIEIAGAELEAVITDEVNRVCAEDASEGEMSYRNLVNLQYDDEGKLIGLTTNMAELNTLKANITKGVAKKLRRLDQTKLSVPLGSVSGMAVLSGFGPSIPVEVLSVGRMSSAFESNFNAAGINQTEHQIQLVISVDVVLLLPGGTCKRNCTNQITVAESVLMGEVPSNYSYFSQFDSASDASAAAHDYGTQ